MRMYLLTQNVNTGWDTFHGAVVIAESKEQAQQVCPAHWADSSLYSNMTEHEKETYTGKYGCWAHPSKVKVEYLGIYHGPLTEPGVILADFKAG